MENNSSQNSGEQFPAEVIEQIQAESAEPEPKLHRDKETVRSPLLNDPDNPNQTTISGTVGYDQLDSFYRHKKEQR